MTTTTVSPEKQIENLTARLEALEDRSSPEARKIRKQIRAIKDANGIDRTRLTLQKSAPVERVEDIFATVKNYRGRIATLRNHELFVDNMPDSPETVIARAASKASHTHRDSTRTPCRKCHTLPDPDTLCRKCHTPLCNCSKTEAADGLCKKCRKAAPRIAEETKNLGKFGARK